jgi:ankyrin repeat protein
MRIKLILERFRWVTCQIDVLRTCISPAAINQALKSLPETLDETYERVLLNIPLDHSKYALRILQWLVFSTRPLQINEVAELLVADPEGSPEFDLGRRPFHPRDIASYCGSLVATQPSTEEIRLAHYSVQEFLLSNRLTSGCEIYKITKQTANISIAKTCLAYLTGAFESGLPAIPKELPLAKYAAEHWTKHAYAAEGDYCDDLTFRIVRFLEPEIMRHQWIKLLRYKSRLVIRRDVNVVNQPLYYASLNGLEGVVKVLLDRGADVNEKGGYYGPAIYAALFSGHEALARLLLEKGADLNAQGGSHYSFALYAASMRDNKAAVRFLLEKVADVDPYTQNYSSALYAASYTEDEATVRLLLEKGVDVNAKGIQNGNALYAASLAGHEAMVQLLLERGADVNHGNALYTASLAGHKAVVQLLLEKGSEVNARGGKYGSSLQAASHAGHIAVVQLLLEKGADVNAQGTRDGNALYAASLAGHEAMVRLLLDNGADVNARVGRYGNALYAASHSGHGELVRLLFEKGARVESRNRHYLNALKAASDAGHKEVVRLLLSFLRFNDSLNVTTT